MKKKGGENDTKRPRARLAYYEGGEDISRTNTMTRVTPTSDGKTR